MSVNGFPLSVLGIECERLDDAELGRRYGELFLVMMHVCGPTGASAKETRRHLGPVPLDTAPFGIETEMIAFAVRRAPGSQLGFVSVGRLAGNDIVLPSDTVSKFHAYVKPDTDGALVLLQDGRSRNGTYVDGEAVARRGEGPPTKLRSGAQVRFGSVSMVCLDLAGTKKLALAARPLSKAS